MNHIDTSRNLTVINANKVSRIPRWCQDKYLTPTPILACPPSKEEADTSPKVFTNDELIGICEPPALQEEALHSVWRAKAQRKEIDDRLKETVAYAEFLKRKLKETKGTIETITVKLEVPDKTQDPNSEFAGEFKDGFEETFTLSEPQNRRLLQEDLVEAIIEEDRITKELEKAHRQLWKAGLADQCFSLEVEDKLNPIIQLYDERKEFLVQKRARRERVLAHNAKHLRKQTFTSVADTIKQTKSDLFNKKSERTLKVLGAKNARMKMDHHIRKTMVARKQKKLLESCDQQMKQDRQHRLLSHLKKEIDSQRDSLLATNQARQKMLQRVSIEKQKIRQEFVKSGKNPYYIEHLLAMEEKRAIQQRKILEKETVRLTQLQRDYEVIEKSKKLEELRRQKWEAFWAKNLEKKKKSLAQKQAIFFDNDDGETYKYSTQIQEETQIESVNEPITVPPGPAPTDPVSPTAKNDMEGKNAKVGNKTKKTGPSSSSKGTSKKMQINRSVGANDAETPGEESRRNSSTEPENLEGETEIGPRKSWTSSEPPKSSISSSKRRSTRKSATPNEAKQIRGSRRGTDRDAKLLKSSQSTNEGVQNAIRPSLRNEKKLEDYEDIDETLDFDSFKSEEYERGSLHQNQRQGRLRKEIDNEEETVALNAGWGDSAEKSPFSIKDSMPKHSREIMTLRRKTNKPIYKRPAFQCHPTMISFSDYEVGKVYKKTLTVTNMSTQRVKFFLQQFVDNDFISSAASETQIGPEEKAEVETRQKKIPLMEVVQVKHTVSKIISPGLTHEVHLTFTPTTLDDWKGSLKFESNMESFQVDVECLKKRFLPMVTPVNATFSNVVAGTSAFVKIKITNTGAKVGSITSICQEFTTVLHLRNVETEFSVSHSDSHPHHHIDHDHGQHSEHHHPVTHVIDYHQSLTSNNPSHAESISSHRPGGHKDHGSKKGGIVGEAEKPHHSHSESIKQHSSQHSAQHSAQHTKLVKSLLNDILTEVTEAVFLSYVKECNREMDMHSSRTIIVFFRPPSVDMFQTHFEIHFDDSEVEKISFDAVGTSVENHVGVEHKNTDFRICMMDHNYQELVSVSTSIRGAGKVIPEIPKELRPFVDVAPKQATIFGNTPGRFCVKFHPHPQMFQDNAAAHYIDKDTNIIDFPIYFHLKFPFKVNTPISATFMAVLTNQQLEITPHEIDMGTCTSIESVQNSFTIFNNSMLPQHIGFLDVPQCISIQPNYGFGTLLPFERRSFDIMLSLPENANTGECTYTFKCQTLENKEYLITVRAMTKISCIHLSQTRISFPVTPVGSVATASFEIFSQCPHVPGGHLLAKTPAKFEFNINPEFPITIFPKAGFVENDASVRIVIRFEARLSEKQVKVHLLKMLENEFVQSQAVLQRELEGINHTLNYEMVFGEDDADPEFLRLITSTRSSELSRKSVGQIDFGILRKERSSYIEKAPKESNIRLSSAVKAVASPNSSSLGSNEKGRRYSKKKSKLLLKTSDLEPVKKLSISSYESGRRGSESGGSNSQKRKTNRSVLGLLKDSEEGSQFSINRPSKSKLKSVYDQGYFMREAYLALEHRREEILQLLATSFDPPDEGQIDVGSREFSKARRDLLKRMPTAASHYSIPCFVTDPDGTVDVLILFVKCAISQPSVMLLDESNTFDFGTVAIGSKSYREIHFYNGSPGPIKLKLDNLNPHVGPFVQCNALRKFPTDHVFTLKFRYYPKDPQEYMESLRVVGGDSHFTINLRGITVVPGFSIMPLKREIFIGTIPVGKFGYQEFEITNSCAADLDFTVNLVKKGYYEGNYEPPGIIFQLQPSDANPTPPPTRNRKGSADEEKVAKRESRKSVFPVETLKEDAENPIDLPNAKRASKPNRKESMAKRKSRKSLKNTSVDNANPIPPNPTFTLKNGNDTLNLNTNELVSFLQEEKEQYFFQSIPSEIRVAPGTSSKFLVFFLPAESGRFFSDFQIRLYENLVHEFTIVGIGENLWVSDAEAE